MKRLLAIALCAAMLLSLYACKAGDSNVGTADFEAQYIRTNGGSENTKFPSAYIIRSAEQLASYYEKNKSVFDLERREQVYADTTIGFLDASEKYDESYFKDQILVLVLLEEGSGSIRHNVAKVERSEDGKLHMDIQKRVPEVGTEDMAQWHIFIEIGKEYDVSSAADVIINEQVNQASTETTQPGETEDGPTEFLLKVTSIDGVAKFASVDNSTALRKILESLSYSKLELCNCEPEYTLDNGYGVQYSVNLTEGYARCDKGQATLSDQDLKTLKTILNWANTEYIGGGHTAPSVPTSDVAFDAQYVRTDGYRDGAVFPRVVIIRSTEALRAYYEQNKNTFDLNRKDQIYSDSTIGFLDACDKYDETYFKEHFLVMVLLEEGSGSIRHEVTNVSLAADGTLNIEIDATFPEICTADMAQWHILVEIGNDVEVSSSDNVLINGKSVSQELPENAQDK